MTEKEKWEEEKFLFDCDRNNLWSCDKKFIDLVKTIKLEDVNLDENEMETYLSLKTKYEKQKYLAICKMFYEREQWKKEHYYSKNDEFNDIVKQIDDNNIINEVGVENYEKMLNKMKLYDDYEEIRTNLQNKKMKKWSIKMYTINLCISFSLLIIGIVLGVVGNKTLNTVNIENEETNLLIRFGIFFSIIGSGYFVGVLIFMIIDIKKMKENEKINKENEIKRKEKWKKIQDEKKFREFLEYDNSKRINNI